jgi:exodeoxyribonuclease VII large subunit
VWAFAPVQDRHAAPAIMRALSDLAACEEVDVIVVARGGGSLADLFAFCDETLCRTVALLRVPVIASVGHHTDRTLIDDVAAVACSTPTHAAEAAVPVDCVRARAELAGAAARLDAHGRRAIVSRARTLAQLSRAPAEHVGRHRARLHQHLRELRASARRGVLGQSAGLAAQAAALDRRASAARSAVARDSARTASSAGALARASASSTAARRRDLERLALALAAHEPARTLERGYALVEAPDGAPITSAAAAREQPRLVVRLHDGGVPMRPETTHTPPATGP